ncbi:MAG TPA: class F sortase [Candidatus Saccharimonadales bacterium]|nr:class F sortase [Candidatus Saccharimonadales bacterium]
MPTTLKPVALYGIMLLLIAGAAIWLWRPSPLPIAKTPPVVTHSADRPSETKPDPATQQWRGTATQPKYISLPSIQAEGFLQWVGVDQHKTIAVPSNIHMAGWYVDSRSPGERGLSIIDGHVDGRTEGGIFKDLAKLRPQDRFSITFGDDSEKTFVVRKVHRKPAAEAAVVLFSQDPAITAQLNLITCGGRFDRKTGVYEERIIVVASRL